MYQMLNATDVANFFDELDERYLIPFDWTPNELLPNKKTYRLKDRFLVKFDGKVCRFKDLEKCRIAFHGIFQDNVIYVYKCFELLDKLKKIVDPEGYDYTSTTKNKVLSNQRIGTNTGNTGSSMDLRDNRSGYVGGQVNKATLKKHYDHEKKVVTVNKVLEKTDGEDAIMQYLDPDLKELKQDYKRGESKALSTYQDNTISTVTQTGMSDNVYVTVRSVNAVKEAQALTVEIPRLVGIFLECFNPLFYV